MPALTGRCGGALAPGLLSLAAAPTFAAMAVLAAIHGGEMPAMPCSAAGARSPLTGMAAMYLLMGALHLAPWLELMSRRRGD